MQVIFTVVFGIFEMFQGDWYSGLNFTRSKRLFVMALAALQCSCGSVVEHCVSSTNVMGSIPREHTY